MRPFFIYANIDFLHLLYDLSWNPAYYAIRRHIAGDDGIGSHYASLSYPNARHYGGFVADPDIILYYYLAL